jgi:hypothetical protein
MTTTVDPWADPMAIPGSEPYNRGLDRWSRQQQFARQLATLDQEIHQVTGNLRGVNRDKLNSAEMAGYRDLLRRGLAELLAAAEDVFPRK